MMAILHDEELLRPSVDSGLVDKCDEHSELGEDDKDALALLTADTDRLCTLTLPALQQLALFQQHTLAATESYIASYSASHPVDSCCQCGEQQADCMLFPCQHAVVCYDCSEQLAQCPWKACGRQVDETEQLLARLPGALTSGERRSK